MQKSTDLGVNKTGVKTSPFDSARMAAPVITDQPAPLITPLATVRVQMAQASERVGSIPPPVTLMGMAKTAMTVLKGQRANILIDKLGQRAAFERSGTRLYDALLSKFDAYGSFPGGPERGDLEQIRAEELAHFHLVVEAIESIGADPTAVTPAADRDGVLALGLVQTLSDPRTTLAECLEAVLVAELVDNDCWSSLIALANTLGQDHLAEVFRRALDEEAVHLAKVRIWVKAHVDNEANALPPD